ncbi:AraC-like DNA-binding protein [Silvibacterium bohemicum]|uniref:AraC-like DNA-binding protein n=1 Tax=Silvibacterium bohemicum TaxID=1577686 RepID=A0A841JXY1_9BACT|nr:helix-turn-helix domain-containing protein [Silvibacterium bohemicum]MBB6146010.1 AraC-like DNA-binding protein [Silvibacterium bohemicum]
MLGKTRPDARPEYEERYDAIVGKARGVLQQPASAGKFRHLRMSAPAELSPWVAHFWMTGWQLEGLEPHLVETLPHPNFHLVFESGAWIVSGIHTGKFTRTLEGNAFAFGIKFTPAGFHAFFNQPAASLANKMVSAKGIFGPCIEKLQLDANAEDEMVPQSSAFLLSRHPAPDPLVTQVNQIVKGILHNPEISTVDQLAAFTGMNKRSLQRLFHQYVGATPKWVIRRYRLHELVERCHSGEQLDFAQVAVDLGYFDQAHLINDFRSIVGYSPVQYRKMAKRGD